MTMEESANERFEATPIIPAHLEEISLEDNEQPVPPSDISEEESQALQVRAQNLVNELEGASGSRELELIDGMTSIGTQAQRNSASDMDLLRGRVGSIMNSEGPGSELSHDLVELRVALDQITPHELSKRNGVGRFISAVPFINKLTPSVNVLRRIAIRYEPVSRQVTMIENKLREGQMMLTRDNVEMRKLYEQVEAQQVPIQKNAYLGELVMGHLTELLERTDDRTRAERLRNALHNVSMRVQNLRVMEVVHQQYFVGIEMTRENNTRLSQSVEQTVTLATNVVVVGLAIQQALIRQKDVQIATIGTQNFLGNMIVANADAIRRQTEEIGDIYNNPVIAIDKIEEAHNQLMEAMDIADRLKQQGIDSARVNISRLSQLSTEISDRAAGLQEQKQLSAPSSVEA